MPASPSPRGGIRASVDDGWGPATAVQSGSRSTPRPSSSRGSSDQSSRRRNGSSAPDDDWSSRPAPRAQQRATKAADRRAERSADLEARRQERLETLAGPPERGLPWWAALAVLVVIALIGGVVDTIEAIGISGGFNIGIVAASVLAILFVKRSHMFPVVIAPPIVYSFAAVFQLYFRQRVLGEKGVLIDAASNYLVYGFPAIASASAAVLIIAGIRMIARR